MAEPATRADRAATNLIAAIGIGGRLRGERCKVRWGQLTGRFIHPGELSSPRLGEFAKAMIRNDVRNEFPSVGR